MYIRTTPRLFIFTKSMDLLLSVLKSVEDIDRTCCLMTVCNFLTHGAVGEVVWHNSLDPGSWFGGWLVNRNLNNPLHKYYGCPHVETLQKEHSFIFQHWEAQKKEAERKLPAKCVFLPDEEDLFA